METNRIALYNEITPEHLSEVKAEMAKRGAPVIRAIWSEVYGMWLAVEGSHRIAAARELGLTPIIKDVSGQKTITIQDDAENVKFNIAQLAEELTDQAPRATIINFGD